MWRLDSVQIFTLYARHLAFAFRIISTSLEKWCRRRPCEDLIQADPLTSCEGSSFKSNKGKKVTHLDVRSIENVYYSQESDDGQAYHSRPAPCSSTPTGQSQLCHVGIDHPQTASIDVAHMGQQDRSTEIPIRPSNANAGAKRLLAQLTPLRLRSDGRRGWPMVLRGRRRRG